MAHVRQSRPDSDLRFQVKVLEKFEVVPSLLGSEFNGGAVQNNRQPEWTFGTFLLSCQGVCDLHKSVVFLYGEWTHCGKLTDPGRFDAN